jgi:hypothetical protein
MAVMPLPPPCRHRRSEDRRRKVAAAAAVADDDDPVGDNGEWNARAAGAATMASSSAMDAVARSEAFVGVLARLLLLMVMVCLYDTAISLSPSGSGQTARGCKQMFCTYFKCTAHVRP